MIDIVKNSYSQKKCEQKRFKKINHNIKLNSHAIQEHQVLQDQPSSRAIDVCPVDDGFLRTDD